MPFNARELAAFMLDGAVGPMVVAFYGGWNNGPDPERLGKINRDSFARRAVIDAFAAYHLAQAVVGELDLSVHARWDAAHKAYWKSPNDKALLKEFDSTQAAWDTANQTWLNAMVRELLGMGVEIESSAPATDTQPQAGPATATAAPLHTWTVNKPQRYAPYTAPLHALLTSAHREGKPRPTPRNVVDAWRINKPLEITQVLTDGFNYCNTKGDGQTADLAAIREAIKRMTSTR
jgi:hypothetical protein